MPDTAYHVAFGFLVCVHTCVLAVGGGVIHEKKCQLRLATVIGVLTLRMCFCVCVAVTACVCSLCVVFAFR